MTRPNSDLLYEGQTRHFTSWSGYNLTADHINKALTNTASKTVGLGSDGDDLIGKLMHRDEDGLIVSVQDEGYVELPYSGVSPAINDRIVVDGAGGVRTTAVGHTGGRPKIIDISKFASAGIVGVLQE